MDVLIWGAGAIGGTIGAYLARAGHRVTFVDREEAHVEAMNTKGLKITGPVDAFTVQATAWTPDTLAGMYDTILLCVKAHDTESATQKLRAHLHPHGYVVSVQNGLNELVIEGIVGRERTVGSFINFGADYLEPGVVHFGGRGAVVVGELDGAMTPRLHELHSTLSDFDKNAITTSNIWGYLWAKLAYGAQLFATALTNASIADALADPNYQDVYIALAQETLSVAKAKGVTPESFDGFDPSAFMPEADRTLSVRSLEAMVGRNRQSAKTHSGIWRDLAVRRRRTEVDHQLGPIVTIGAQLGVPTPLTARLIELIHDIEDGKRPQDVTNLDILKALTSPQ
jgi:2-dehydropantoate 2-reductase